jgi:hypothetical protein
MRGQGRQVGVRVDVDQAPGLLEALVERSFRLV